MKDLRKVKCDPITIGQYLQPSPVHHAVAEYVPPDQFQQYGTVAKDMGFKGVASGPLVRSSYQAESMYKGALT